MLRPVVNDIDLFSPSLTVWVSKLECLLFTSPFQHIFPHVANVLKRFKAAIYDFSK
jgi:hypothetical protein